MDFTDHGVWSHVPAPSRESPEVSPRAAAGGAAPTVSCISFPQVVHSGRLPSCRPELLIRLVHAVVHGARLGPIRVGSRGRPPREMPGKWLCS